MLPQKVCEVSSSVSGNPGHVHLPKKNAPR